MSFAKAIVGDTPRGANFVVETDFYYPLYSSISELFPKKKNPAPVTAPKPVAPVSVPPTTVLTNSKYYDFIPGTSFDANNFWERKVSEFINQFIHRMYNHC